MVDASTKHILQRWQALDEGPGLRRAERLSYILRTAGLLLVVFVAAAVANGLDRIAIAVAGVVAGWLIAEGYALRTRRFHWRIFRSYLDWDRIRKDLNDDA
jgi:positive regulator of sigma E activity